MFFLESSSCTLLYLIKKNYHASYTPTGGKTMPITVVIENCCEFYSHIKVSNDEHNEHNWYNGASEITIHTLYKQMEVKKKRWCGTLIFSYIENWQFLNNVIITKTKINLSQT